MGIASDGRSCNAGSVPDKSLRTQVKVWENVSLHQEAHEHNGLGLFSSPDQWAFPLDQKKATAFVRLRLQLQGMPMPPDLKAFSELSAT